MTANSQPHPDEGRTDMSARPTRRPRTTVLRALLAAAVLGALALPAAGAQAAPPFVTQDIAFTADDGTVLHATVGGFGDLSARPIIIEDSPYDPGCCHTFAGEAYNYLTLHWRGTGKSGGSFAATGTRDQKDLAQFVNWACEQPWSDGRAGLYGFSASAIVVYNSMHLPMPCVKAAALMSGTVDLYRDLLYIGGINNTVPGLAVAGNIGGPWLSEQRDNRDPAAFATGAQGHLMAPVDVASHKTHDEFWQERTLKGHVNDFPVLASNGFFDVESRGAFLGYRGTRSSGSKLLVMGAHDGSPAGTPGPFPAYARWFDHHVRGLDNGVAEEPRVDLYLSKGGHLDYLSGDYERVTGGDWPLPQTRWTALHLSPERSGTARSSNDGSLSLEPVTASTVQPYAFAPSNPLATDHHTISTVGGTGGGEVTPNGLGRRIPATRDLTTAEPQSLTYTTEPFDKAVTAVGPVSLTVHLASGAPVTDIVAVLADVAPDGTANPVAQGQLRTSFPYVDRSRSIVDKRTGEVVQPFNDYSREEPTMPGATREYTVEILPIGNVFEPGHRLRLYLTGTAATMQGSAPAVNLLSIGGATPSRLVLPTLERTP